MAVSDAMPQGILTWSQSTTVPVGKSGVPHFIDSAGRLGVKLFVASCGQQEVLHPPRRAVVLRPPHWA